MRYGQNHHFNSHKPQKSKVSDKTTSNFWSFSILWSSLSSNIPGIYSIIDKSWNILLTSTHMLKSAVKNSRSEYLDTNIRLIFHRSPCITEHSITWQILSTLFIMPEVNNFYIRVFDKIMILKKFNYKWLEVRLKSWSLLLNMVLNKYLQLDDQHLPIDLQLLPYISCDWIHKRAISPKSYIQIHY